MCSIQMQVPWALRCPESITHLNDTLRAWCLGKPRKSSRKQKWEVWKRNLCHYTCFLSGCRHWQYILSFISSSLKHQTARATVIVVHHCAVAATHAALKFFVGVMGPGNPGDYVLLFVNEQMLLTYLKYSLSIHRSEGSSERYSRGEPIALISGALFSQQVSCLAWTLKSSALLFCYSLVSARQATSGNVSTAEDKRTDQSQHAHNFPDLRIT